jgi:hypothetical protein
MAPSLLRPVGMQSICRSHLLQVPQWGKPLGLRKQPRLLPYMSVSTYSILKNVVKPLLYCYTFLGTRHHDGESMRMSSSYLAWWRGGQDKLQ